MNGGAGWPALGERIYRVKADPVPDGMVLIPGGTFKMGDAFSEGYFPEMPLHDVTVGSFYIGATEVTKAEWDEVYDWAVAHGYWFAMSGSGKALDHPVQVIEWHDMVKWCNARSEMEGLTPFYYTDAATTEEYTYRSWRTDVQNNWVRWDADGYRLPTEAEWRSGSTRRGAARSEGVFPGAMRTRSRMRVPTTGRSWRIPTTRVIRQATTRIGPQTLRRTRVRSAVSSRTDTACGTWRGM